MSNIIVKIRNFLTDSKRVLRHAKKPSRREISITTKMSAAGILIIGLIGYVLKAIFTALISVINK